MPKNKVDRPVIFESAEEVAQRLGTSVKQISRWAKKLDDPDKFEQHFEASCARYAKILELETIAHVGQNSGENEWYTPAPIIEAARAVLGDIDLDPASTEAANSTVKAAQFFSAEDNGLDQAWHGRVWMNPPYSQPLVQQFADKLVTSVKAGDVTATAASRAIAPPQGTHARPVIRSLITTSALGI